MVTTPTAGSQVATSISTPAATTPLCKYINANYDYNFDSGDSTDCGFASSDNHIYANYDGSDGNADCSDASSDNYNN